VLPIDSPAKIIKIIVGTNLIYLYRSWFKTKLAPQALTYYISLDSLKMKENCRSNVDKIIISLITSGTKLGSGGIKDIDWNHLFQTARANRLDGIIYDSLDRNGLFESLPEEVRKKFEESYQQTVINTRVYLETAGEIASVFSRAEIDLIILRGPTLGLTLYSRPYLRPYGDLDLLIRKEDLQIAKKILGDLGLISLPGLLPDRYFEKHHLHLSFKDPRRNAIVELHWALDHPYTLYTVDYASLFSRGEKASFEGLKIPALSPDDRLITLCLHLVKHCPFLPQLIEEDDLPNLLLKGGWLIWLLDIHLLLAARGESLNWESIRGKAEKWGIDKQVEICLSAAGRIFQTHLPSQYQRQTEKHRISPLEARLYGIQLSRLRGKDRVGRAEQFLFGLRTDTIFRPIRALDLVKYLFPPPEYLRRKYQATGISLILAYPRHTISGAIRLTRNLADLIYYRTIK